ncbi:Butyryl-CoA dehydrogenase [Austwickia sp. TVS 96-490-7B]|uniref:acyl-CoA dehydrogenase n=1 Tax=Austwickia sp. TVS 96-490-7B TaxID=2830843 RepID=UPI001C57B7D3|nr:acyl-CoA dehydrogenase [Austwickia sp. TVS 96-490-7B]MBW3085149.1 Butyryl-CoA dehydrogenase [Austwickia sp. TVS 96-490-7B]
MGHYKSNLRDLEFTLFEVFARQELLGSGPYEDVDIDTAREILHEVARLAENELADSFIDADRNPPVFDPDTHSVTIPESFKKSYKAYTEAGWGMLSVPGELGGTVVPPSLTWAVSELILGANPAVYMYSAGYGFARVLYELGNEAQRRMAAHMVERQWGSTMVLTEPDSGSDFGAGRAKAIPQPDGTWHIEGVKRFITSAEHDMSENIVHLVLARPEGAGPGTKGLSLFVVPKYHVDLETGNLGDRNGVYVTNVEHKMGLKVSTTCELRFGEKEPAVGTLVGDIHDGTAQMFRIIEYARMMVGTKAIATLSTGYLNALDYAKQRVQGADLTRSADKTAPRVTIIHHPDVRRSLMLQKAYAEGLRALVLYTATHQDTIDTYRLTHDGADPDKGTPEHLVARINDLLLPLVKGCGSERAWVLLGTESLQTYGGSGFLQDYAIEQYVRDAKIDTLYEGTTAIQGQDFFFRKIVRDQGQALQAVAAQMMTTVNGGNAADDRLADERALLGKAVEDLQGIIAAMIGAAMAADPRTGGENADITNLYKVGQNTTRLLLAAGDVLIGWLLLRQAEVADTALHSGASSEDIDFYTGKVAAARFFAHTVLPRISAERVIAEGIDNTLMEVPESAF